MNNTRKLVLLGLYVAMALALHVVENMLPVPLAPGARLGLSNIVTLTVLVTMGFKDAFIVLVVRIIMASIFGGSLSTFIYSISGGILSIGAMQLIRFIGRENISLIGVSIIGAVFHNIGQLLAAAMVINNINIFSYLPVLLITAIGTGILIGLTCQFLVALINKHMPYFSSFD